MRRTILLALALVSGCGSSDGNTGTGGGVVAVSLSATTAALVPGQSVTISATPKDASGNTVTGASVTWSSSASSIATVAGDGTITAVASGSTTVTASSGGKSASAAVTVRDGSVIAAAGGSAATANGNARVTVPAGALAAATPISVQSTSSVPADARLVPGTAFEFGPAGTQFTTPVTITISYDPAQLLAGVSGASLQLYKAVGSSWTLVSGSTVNTTTHVVTGATSSFSIYAILGSASAAPVSTVTLDLPSVDLPLGMIVQLTPTFKDAQGSVLTGRTVTWSSSSPSVASVSSTGVVSAAAIGTTAITATSEGKSATATIGVRTSASQRTLSISPGFTNVASTTCMIGVDQHGYCFGQSWFGSGVLGNGSTRKRARPTPITLDRPLSAIIAGDISSCAIDTTHQLWCWGSNEADEFAGAGTSSLVPVQVAPSRRFVDYALTGEGTSCAIDTDGKTWCWGFPAGGDINARASPTIVRVPGDPGFVSIRSGENVMCGLTGDGNVYCWGTLYGFFRTSTTPVLVPGMPPIARISTGTFGACAVAMDGRMFCWGQNFDGSLTPRNDPLQVPGSWRTVASGDTDFCGTTTDNVVKCWGEGHLGTIGAGAYATLPLPTTLAGAPPLAELAMGISTGCGVAVDGAAWCWGKRGELGDDDFGATEGPVRVLVGENAQAIVHGFPSTCLIDTGKQLRCWAEQARAADLVDTLASWSAATPSVGPLTVKDVAAGFDFICAIMDATSRVGCWGEGLHGELGNGVLARNTQLTQIASTRTFTSIVAAETETCGITTAKELFCWGSEDDRTVWSAVPIQLLNGTNWTSVWSDNVDYAFCVISDAAAAWCGSPRDGFSQVAPAQHWAAMYKAYSYMCGLDTAGLAWCTGDNSSGQLGDGTNTDRTTMTAVAGGLHFTQLVSDGGTNCGLVADGNVYCWGYPASGAYPQANDSPLSYNTPTLLPGGLHFTRLSMSLGCGIVAGGNTYCWGADGYVGDGQPEYRNAPVRVAGGFRFALYEPGSAATLRALGVRPQLATAPRPPALLVGPGAAAAQCPSRSVPTTMPRRRELAAAALITKQLLVCRRMQR